MTMKDLSSTEIIVMVGLGAFIIYELTKGSSNFGENAGQGSNNILGGNTGNAANNSFLSGNTFGFGGNSNPPARPSGDPSMNYGTPGSYTYFGGRSLNPPSQPSGQQLLFPGS